MNESLAERYYRLALSAAARRNLSCATEYARYACLLDAMHKDAAKLLKLCLYELGEPCSEYAGKFKQIRALAALKMWKRAGAVAGSIPRQSVLVLNIQGYINACAKRYDAAARFFAKALEKDSGNSTALAGLTEISNNRKR